jgi:Fe-S cluster biogenesis protein NfuA
MADEGKNGGRFVRRLRRAGHAEKGGAAARRGHTYATLCFKIVNEFRPALLSSKGGQSQLRKIIRGDRVVSLALLIRCRRCLTSVSHSEENFAQESGPLFAPQAFTNFEPVLKIPIKAVSRGRLTAQRKCGSSLFR